MNQLLIIFLLVFLLVLVSCETVNEAKKTVEKEANKLVCKEKFNSCEELCTKWGDFNFCHDYCEKRYDTCVS